MNNKRQREVEVAIGQERQKSEAEKMQLPLQRLVPFPFLTQSANGNKECALCEYILHFVQESITNPVNEVMIFRLLI